VTHVSGLDMKKLERVKRSIGAGDVGTTR
jgi:hypothetical protein